MDAVPPYQAAASWADTLIRPIGACLGNFDSVLMGTSDFGHLLLCGAYLVGVPFCCMHLWRIIPENLRVAWWLGVGFVYLCGVSRLLEVMITHQAGWYLYQIVNVERILTGIVSWAFVLAVFQASRRLKERDVADSGG